MTGGDLVAGPETLRALILAAGLSRRMGRCKQLLPMGGGTVVESAVKSALDGGARTAVVVTGFRGDEIRAVLEKSFGDRVLCMPNPDYADTDMLRSVQIGAAAMPACGAFFLLPGDMPSVSADTFRRLAEARAERRAPVIFPVLGGRRSHPPLIDADLIPAILAYGGEDGLRGLWRRYESEVLTVPVEDAGVRLDLDTPEDYRKVSELPFKEG